MFNSFRFNAAKYNSIPVASIVAPAITYVGSAVVLTTMESVATIGTTGNGPMESVADTVLALSGSRPNEVALLPGDNTVIL